MLPPRKKRIRSTQKKPPKQTGQMAFPFASPEASREWMKRELVIQPTRTNRGTLGIQATINRHPVGKILYVEERLVSGQKKERVVWNLDIFVSPEYSRQGIATRLVKKVIALARKRNAQLAQRVHALRAYVETNDPRTEGLLQKTGFKYVHDIRTGDWSEKPTRVYEYPL